MILPPGQAGIAVGAADHEPACRIDEKLGAPASRPAFVEHRLDDFLDHAFADGAVGRAAGCRSARRAGWRPRRSYRDRPIALVLHRHLGLAVGPQPLDPRAVGALPHRGQPLGDPVRQHDRQRHALAGLVGGVTEHHALVAGALHLLAVRIDAHRDVRRLAVDRREHGAGAAVHAVGGVGVADALHRPADQVGDVDVGLGRDLARDDRHPGGHQRLARDAARPDPAPGWRRARRRMIWSATLSGWPSVTDSDVKT